MNKRLDLNDQAKLRHNRDRNLGFPIGQHIQPPPMLFNRDGLNVFLGDMFKGRSAFLILGGPSFGELIKGTTTFRGQKVSNEQLLKHPGFVTMATNNSPRTFRPDLWTMVDDPGNFIKSIWLDPKIMKFVPFDHTEKKLFDNEKWEEMDVAVGECPNIFFYRRNEHFSPSQWLHEGTFNWGEHSDSLDELGHKGGRSVMLVAIRLLYYLGIRNIFLLGCDFKMDDKTKYHFDQDRSPASQRGNNSTYNILKARFEALVPEFEKAGLKVFNCNPDSDLKVFPHIPFDEAIHIATAEMPNIATERTAGLYDRKANEKAKNEKKAQVIPTPQTNLVWSDIDLTKTTFTEEDRLKIKKELDSRRHHLNEMKHQRDMYKLMPDAKPEHIAALEEAVTKARQSFRSCEEIKNKVWGIKK
jgi:hypothetical protein